ncbi:MAG: glycosyltransferase family 2 protein [Thermodesulfobacteriota bacterium]|nr:glycosyltransferase family 2 protein [Thermodesulfobacteriota bacterium]
MLDVSQKSRWVRTKKIDAQKQSKASRGGSDVDLTVVIPMYNEEENVRSTIESIEEELSSVSYSWEILIVDDGSRDNTYDIAKDIAESDKNVRVISYPSNAGRGKAMRTGFANAQGRFVVTTDADLSYDARYIKDLADEIMQNEDIDIVIGSPYISGGGAESVPFFRLLISKLGNKIVGYSLGNRLNTVTGILRIYKRSVLDSLELESDGKEIHLEILTKATAVGYKVKEVPAVLKGRKKGKSKFKLRATVISHMTFSLYERPAMLFGFFGFLLIIAGLIFGSYISVLRFLGTLNPGRPLLYLTILSIVVGIQMLSFGFLANQLVYLKKNIFIIQRENKQLEQRLKERETQME